MESGLDDRQPFGTVAGASAGQADSETTAWFCVRTHPKHEHIAAAQLRQETGIEVFLPRIRYKRSVRFGMVWVTEALFRDYLFARFDLLRSFRRVQHARSVRGVVHFGNRWPAVSGECIDELRVAMGSQELRLVEESLESGDLVKIAEGPLQGLDAVVTRVMPAHQRVAVLLEFLGQQTMVEMNRHELTLADASQKPHFSVWQARRRVTTTAT